ncbi:MAG: N-acetyltransferase [Bdellovibrionales bacterium]|nr:N-acetyltransferase [Bdellovibrionales bacterium]
MADASVEHYEHQRGGEWVIHKSEDEGKLARMTYVRVSTDKIVIDHTLVPESWSGQGLAKALLETAIQYLRDTNTLTAPTCPYARAQLKKHKEWHDVLSPEVRPKQ